MSVEVIFLIRNKEYDNTEIKNYDDLQKLPILFLFTQGSILGAEILDSVNWNEPTVVKDSMVENWMQYLECRKNELKKEVEKFDTCIKYEPNYTDRLELLDLQREVLDDIDYIDKAMVKLQILADIVSFSSNEVIIEVSY